MSDKITKRPLPVDVFGSSMPFPEPPAYDDGQVQMLAIRAATKQSNRLELYERFHALPVSAKFRIVYLSEMEMREAVVALYEQYQTAMLKLQEVIGAQNETINALINGLAELEARTPKPQEEAQLSPELDTAG